MTRLLNSTKYFLESYLNSYSQIFFSNNKLFAIILIIVTFFDLGAGLSGILSVVTCQLTASLFHFNKEDIRNGSLTYNPLMVGMALGFFYELNVSLIVILVIISILTLLVTVWFANIMGKRGLPFLSIPFLIGLWIVLLALPNFTAAELKIKETLTLAAWFPNLFAGVSDFVDKLPFPNLLHLYFRSLGAIFFQYNDLAGILIAIGVLIYSRMGFVLTIYSFLIGFGFYQFFEGDFTHLVYSYIGFNFILTAIALGGFFVVPSRKSFLMLLFTIPVIAIFISAFHSIFVSINLPMYSLPFNVVTLLFIATMKTRQKTNGINLVPIQKFSPEKNHYAFFNNKQRFGNSTFYIAKLPIMGTWRVSQGHNGDITHTGEWQHAWDFDVIDEDGSTYKGNGDYLDDYYCYNLPIIAPASGYVVNVMNDVDDNQINKVNLKQNWGNTIIIKHGEYFFSKISHLKKGSIKFNIGDYVQAGEQVANCGSSGRSPEPHLHFQFQATPDIGSRTFEFPISYYMQNNNDKLSLKSFSLPKQGELVSNVNSTYSLKKAFDFTPGKNMKFEFEGELYTWVVFTNSYNQTYIYCKKTNSHAYFINNGTMHYFTDFYGKKGSLLHHFFYASHKIMLGYYKDIEIEEPINTIDFFNPVIKVLHDFTAPFFHYCKVKYKNTIVKCNDEHNPTEITMETSCTAYIGRKEVQKTSYSFEISDNSIKSFSINKTKKAICID